jgi:hypothetical protein
MRRSGRVAESTVIPSETGKDYDLSDFTDVASGEFDCPKLTL